VLRLADVEPVRQRELISCFEAYRVYRQPAVVGGCMAPADQGRKGAEGQISPDLRLLAKMCSFEPTAVELPGENSRTL